MNWSSVQLQESDKLLLDRLLDIIGMSQNYLTPHIEDSLEALEEVRDMDTLAVQSQELS